jgi:hypothetical protein
MPRRDDYRLGRDVVDSRADLIEEGFAVERKREGRGGGTEIELVRAFRDHEDDAAEEGWWRKDGDA